MDTSEKVIPATLTAKPLTREKALELLEKDKIYAEQTRQDNLRRAAMESKSATPLDKSLEDCKRRLLRTLEELRLEGVFIPQAEAEAKAAAEKAKQDSSETR